MRCRYCHNPDTWQMGGTSKCQTATVADLLNQAERYRDYWGAEGGITVSGGEALLQLDFLTELFSEAKRRSISTCLDTSAQPFSRKEPFFSKFERLMQLTDTVLLDIKHIDDEAHRQLTGHSNRNILDCARHLSDKAIPVWIRHVLVPSITDNDGQLQRLNLFLRTLNNIERIEVLPYHTLGTYKWKQLDIPYTLEGVQPPTQERVANAERILREGVQFIGRP